MVIGNVWDIVKHEHATDVLLRTFPEKADGSSAVLQLCTTSRYLYLTRCYTAPLIILRSVEWPWIFFCLVVLMTADIRSLQPTNAIISFWLRSHHTHPQFTCTHWRGLVSGYVCCQFTSPNVVTSTYQPPFSHTHSGVSTSDYDNSHQRAMDDSPLSIGSAPSTCPPTPMLSQLNEKWCSRILTSQEKA